MKIRKFIAVSVVVVNISVAVGLLMSYMSSHINPLHGPMFAFFGLSYPLWLLSNLGFVVFWLFVKWRRCFWSLIPLVLGVNYHATFFAFNSANEPSGDLHIMSYNVRVFDLYNWTEGLQTRDSIFVQLETEAPDIICFQEFYYTERKGVFETRDTLIQILGMPFIHEKYTHKINGQQYFGVATLSKYPIVGEGSIAFASDKHNFCIYSDHKIGSDTIRVYNAHLASIRLDKVDYAFMNESQRDMAGTKRIYGRLKSAFQNRAEQVSAVLEEVKRSPYPVVLCGDFNDTPLSYCYNEVAAQLEDAFIEAGSGIGGTYIGRFPSFRIDYIFHSPGIAAEAYHTLPQELSDHHAIQAWLTLPKQGVDQEVEAE